MYTHVGSLDEFLRAYVNKFKISTVTTLEWKDFFLEFFDKEVRVHYIMQIMLWLKSISVRAHYIRLVKVCLVR